MCHERSSVRGRIRGRLVKLDRCIRNEIERLNQEGHITVASCCGHGVYPMSVLVNEGGRIHLLGSDLVIPRTRNFYRMDAKGFYFIPEMVCAGRG